MVKIDIRQESIEHTQAFSEVTEYIGLGCYEEWNEERRYAFLLDAFQNKRPLIPRGVQFSTRTQEILDTFAMLANYRDKVLEHMSYPWQDKPLMFFWSNFYNVKWAFRTTSCCSVV